MAKITEITYSESKTIQEESFSPRNFHISAKMELVDNESPTAGYDILKRLVKKELQDEIDKIKGADITESDDVPF